MAPQGTLTIWQLLLQKIQVTFPIALHSVCA